MYENKKKLKKILSFYCSLPDDIKRKMIDSVQYINREHKRKFGRIKSENEKLEKLMFEDNYRRQIVDCAYRVTKDKTGLDISESEYDEIIASYTAESCIYSTIFFFRWCYEKDYDNKYFNEFLDSPEFEKTLSKDFSFEPSEESVTENDDNNTECVSESIEEYTEDTGMKLYGRIEQRMTFYNFFPQYEYINGRLHEFTKEELMSGYPSNGAINLAYVTSEESEDFLQNIDIDKDTDTEASCLYILDTDKYDIEENNNSTYQYKIDLQKLVARGIRLSDVISPLYNENVYKIVTPEFSCISDKDFANSPVYLNETNLLEGEPVLLKYNEKYYGTFYVRCRIQDGKYYIKTDANINNFILYYYSEDDIDIMEFEKQAYREDPTYTNCARITGKRHIKDIIPRQTLLEKIGEENISLSIAEKNPEEFMTLCNNSPFFSDIPAEVRESRINQLHEIITDTKRFQDEKRTLFESMLKYCQEKGDSGITDKMISESGIYKSLQSELEIQRSELEKQKENNEKLTAQINELKELNQKLQISSSGDTYQDSADEIKNENPEHDISESIKSLQEQQQKLIANNEFLMAQAQMYKARIKSAQEEISRAIEESIANTAKNAFEPYISNAMLKAAAKWDSDEESEKYSMRADMISKKRASSLSGTALTEYLVKSVQSKRNYTRNEIINIFISITQNFITIFSGDPGTGKTSVCNIIADVLGLNSFGSDNNRYISVSVERGWSSKRDFIGYFNPLTKKYDKSNGRIYDALMLLNEENKKSVYPYLIMLDEANLSPMEYYWADFMPLSDRVSDSDMYINIGTEKELFVPETLRFMATVNTDRTTEELSPRLIDRACIIKLPDVRPKESESEDIIPELISWQSLSETFAEPSPVNGSLQKLLEDIYSLFETYGMNISPRIRIAVNKYIGVAQGIMDSENNASPQEKALDYAVVQKLLPKINGCYEDYEGFFEALKKICTENHLSLTGSSVERMENSRKKNMGYCQYLI